MNLISSYGDGGFKVNGKFIPGSLIIFPENIVEIEVSESAQISSEIIQPIINRTTEIEILLIGTGETMTTLPDIRNFLKVHNITTDFMDTGAASRTYNVLAGEERRVAALLIAV